jgi:hypothetical protein
MTNPLNKIALNYGKVLVLDAKHTLSVDEIKVNTFASKVIHFIPSNRTGIKNNFLHAMLSDWLASIGTECEYEIYFVKGRNARSSYLSLSGNDLIGAYILESKMMQDCHNCAMTIHAIEKIKAGLETARHEYIALVANLILPRTHMNLNQYPNELNQITGNYCLAELTECKDIVRNTLTNRW